MQPQYTSLPKSAINLTGQRFKRLVALAPTRYNHKIHWECLCDCGNILLVSTDSLRSGNTGSCGCLRKELLVKRSTTHGLRTHFLYTTWQGILRRCTTPSNLNYFHYGGRGISVYPQWKLDFHSFYSYVTSLPRYNQIGHTLDRIDNNGNYEPGNLRWITMKEQCRNTRKNILLTYKDKTQSIAAWSEELNLHASTLYGRHRLGWTDTQILTTPIRNKQHL